MFPINNIYSGIREALFGASETDIPDSRSLAELAGASHEPCRIATGKELLEDPICLELLQLIERELGVAPTTFNRRFLPLLQRASEFYQLTPASRICHHYHPGGSVVHGLEACLRILVQLSGSNIDAFMPRRPRVPPSDRSEFKLYSRIVFGLIAMIHDIGKIRTDVDYVFFDNNDRIINVARSYDPDGAGGRYSQTLVEYVRQILDTDINNVRYSWRYRAGRKVNGHDADWFRALDGIFMTTRIRIPAAVRDAYLDPQGDLWGVVGTLKRDADHYSVEQFIANEPTRNAVGRFNQHPDAIAAVGILHWLATNNHLQDLVRVGGKLFLSRQTLASVLAELPDLDDFGRIMRNPTHPEPTMAVFVDRGLTHRSPEFAEPHGQFSQFDGALGVFLHQSLTGWIYDWQVTQPPAFIDEALENAVLEHQQAPGDSSNVDVSEIRTSHASEYAADFEDVSGFGDPIPLADEETAATIPPDDPLPPSPSIQPSLNGLEPDYPKTILGIGTFLQRLTPEQIEKSDMYEIQDDLLFIDRLAIQKVLQRHGTLSVEKFRAMSEEHASDRWRVMGDQTLLGILCSARYTAALLNPNSTDMLLLPMLDDEPDETPTPPTDGKKTKKSNAAPPKAAVTPPTKSVPKSKSTAQPTKSVPPAKDSTPANRKLSLEGFCEAMAASNLPSTGYALQIVDDQLRVPMPLVDEYIVKPHLRGNLTTALKAQSAFTKRSKKFFYLDPNHRVISQWLDKLPIQT